MTPSKPPTPQGISALLKRAGFNRGNGGTMQGRSSGYAVSKWDDQAVTVAHITWSWHPPAGLVPEMLAKYAKVITEAGYTVETEDDRLIVTAGKEG